MYLFFFISWYMYVYIYIYSTSILYLTMIQIAVVSYVLQELNFSSNIIAWFNGTPNIKPHDTSQRWCFAEIAPCSWNCGFPQHSKYRYRFLTSLGLSDFLEHSGDCSSCLQQWYHFCPYAVSLLLHRKHDMEKLLAHIARYYVWTFLVVLIWLFN